MAVAESLLTSIYHMLKDCTMHTTVSAPSTSIVAPPTGKKSRLVKRLADLGYAVKIQPLAA